MLKSQKGITLVALVVTIVVLIILATISISVALQGGLIGKAEGAAQWQANADAAYQELETTVVTALNQYEANAQATNP